MDATRRVCVLLISKSLILTAEFRAVRATNAHCTGGPVGRKLLKRALGAQLS